MRFIHIFHHGIGELADRHDLFVRLFIQRAIHAVGRLFDRVYDRLFDLRIDFLLCARKLTFQDPPDLILTEFRNLVQFRAGKSFCNQKASDHKYYPNQ